MTKRAKYSIFPAPLSATAKEEMRQALSDILTGTITGSPVYHAAPLHATVIALLRLKTLAVDHDHFMIGHYTFKLTERGAALLDQLS